MRWLFILILTGFCVAASEPNTTRAVQPFDKDWRFLKADVPGAEQPAFSDTAWSRVDVPHDWSIAGPFAETNQAGGAGGFLPSGVSWYRKHFLLPKAASGKSVAIEFDGVMQNSDVWINGYHLGHRPYGYVGFSYELTGHLNFGGDNVIAVRADTSAQPASRWYSGAGIYRPVRLVVVDPVHIEADGVFVSTPKVSPAEATVAVQTIVTNASAVLCEVTIQTVLLSPKGKTVAMVESRLTITNASSNRLRQQIDLPQPQLWNLEVPNLYCAVTKVIASGKTLDETTNTFGIRAAHFEAATGFWLNGKNLKLKGVCLHHDGGAFGAAVPFSIWAARLNALRSLGVNAIRTAHNPAAPEFLDLCDRMGFLVMDEFFDCWTVAKNPYDYHLFFNEWSKRDAAAAIRRDRNHPSVIIYSVGNEIHDTPKPDIAIPILKGLVEVCHENDPTRPATQALFRPNVSHDYDNGLADLLDVVGQNYREKEILAAHAQKPSRKIVGTENTHDRKQWTAVRDNAPYAGQFLWTGIDYLGEVHRWPLVGHASGLLDRTGAVKPMAYERQSWWSESPMVRVVRRTAAKDRMPGDPGYGDEELHTQVQFADWTPRNPAPHDETVEAYSNCEEVELFLNGRSLGAKKLPPDASPRVWKVAFASGNLKAVAKNGGKVVASDQLQTAGKAVRLQLDVSNSKLGTSWDDVVTVRVTVMDANGICVPRADDLISFKVSGPGVIAAVDNGDNASHELFQAHTRRAFHGRCVAFVKATRATGKIILQATASGLTSGTTSIDTSAASF